ncbi:unnamed protein product [Discula destructiva]
MASQLSASEPVLIGVYGPHGCEMRLFIERVSSLIVIKTEKCAFYDLDRQVRHVQLQEKDSQYPRMALKDLRDAALNTFRDQCREEGRMGIVFATGQLLADDLLKPDTQPDPARDEYYPLIPGFSHAIYYEPPVHTTHLFKTVVPFGVSLSIPEEELAGRFTQSRLKELRAFMEYCLANKVLMQRVGWAQAVAPSTWMDRLIHHEARHAEVANERRATVYVEKWLNGLELQTNEMVVIAADNILAERDSTAAMMEGVPSLGEGPGAECTFLGHTRATYGYSYKAFRQLSYFYEASGRATDRTCDLVGQTITLNRDFEQLLWKLKLVGIPTLALTCGMQAIWKKVLSTPFGNEKSSSRLSDTMGIVRNGPGSDVVVTPVLKGAIIRWLRQTAKRRLYVIGGNEVDVPMLKEAGKNGYIWETAHGMSPDVKALLREQSSTIEKARFIVASRPADNQGSPDNNTADFYELMDINAGK